MIILGFRFVGPILLGMVLLPGGCSSETSDGKQDGTGGATESEDASATGASNSGASLTAGSASASSSATAAETTATSTADSAGSEPGDADSTASDSSGGTEPPAGATDPNLRVAFIGDSGNGGNFVAVMELIKSENADFVIHSGDLGYDAVGAADWSAQIDATLGETYPYFASIGNHDSGEWDTYTELLETRLSKIKGVQCEGEYGISLACHYRGLFFMLSGVGETGSGHEGFLLTELEADESLWSVCSWHKNQREMQAGGKSDETGWGVYEACQQGGAIIATGHEHSYSRTRTLTDLGASENDHGVTGEEDLVRVSPGETFVFVSGLGGQGIRDYHNDLHDGNSWWSTIMTSDFYMKHGEVLDDFEPDFGALFIDFYVGGDPYRAHAYFKTINGFVADEFEIVTQ